ncbi:MAG: MMPL family transporter [Clostridiaceae bacterium]|jgi:predicted RND superfamily exporter protein|nr:MMPL family transporter [Clostridiaceae bacterium]
MNKIAGLILKHKRSIIIINVLLLAIGALLIPMIAVNFNLSDYLPDNAPSTESLRVMEASFSDDIPNVNVYIPDVSIPEAIGYKESLAQVSGVSSVLWLDDVADIRIPLEIQDQKTVEAWYKDGGALFVMSVDQDNATAIVEDIRGIAGPSSSLSGEAVNQASVQSTTMGEISMIMLYVIPIVIIILLLSTSSWFEPVLFLITIGVAIAINEGTNIFLGEISYVTRATSAVLQLAVSIDYAVFLLHRFAEYRDEGADLKLSMRKAIVKSSSAIAASAATTVFGFLALTLMKFKIGADLGFVLAKGVVISYISVMTLLPAMAVYTAKIMDKTRHRPLLPSFKGFGRLTVKVCIPLAIIIVLIMIPSFMAQRHNEFLYGSSGMHSEGSQVKNEADVINGIFGQSQQMVLLVPEGDIVKEIALTEELSSVDEISSVVSYAGTVGALIPSDFLDEDTRSQFYSNGYSRMVITGAIADEGDEAFALTENIRSVAQSYYGEGYYLLGQNVVNYDLKETITNDYLPVTLASVIAIGLVLVITFKSITVPLILMLVIEGAIWINLGLPYFVGDSLNYIGYQIISAVQLGATIDYGILFAQRYLENRRIYDKREAARTAVAKTAASILTPAGILTAAGLILGFISTNGIISQLGSILGRGAAISAAMVLLFLPALLIIFDGLIQKTMKGYIRKQEREDELI